MRKLLVFVSGLILALNAVALPEFDPFEDPSGADLAGQPDATGQTWNAVGFGQNATGNKPVIAAGSLGYAGLPASTSNSVFLASNGNAGQVGRIPLGTTVVSNALYYSFIMKVSSLGTMGTAAAANFIAAFSDTAGSQTQTLTRAGGRLVMKKNGTGYQVGIGLGNTTTEYQYESTVRNLNDVLFVVVAYEAVIGSTNVYLWVNPPSASFGSNAPPAAITNLIHGNITQNINPSGAAAFIFSCQSAAIPSVTIDDLRIGKSWMFVTGGPEIGTQPANMTRNAGSNAVLSVVARGASPLSYQWQRNAVALTDTGNIFGSTTASLTVSNLLQSDAGSYTVVVTNSYASITSSVAVLTVQDPAINAQPLSQNLPAGGTANFSVVAGGTPALTYQWIKDDTTILADGGIISGAHTASLTLTGISAADAGGYSVLVTNGLGNSVTSAVATLSVTDPAVTQQPANQSVNYSSNVTFSVTAAGTGPFVYQWHKLGFGDLTDGGNIAGSSSSALSLAAVSYLDAGSYYVTVSNSLSIADSSNAVLTVKDPVIYTNPVSTVATAGTTITLSVLADGSPTLTYQWQRFNTNIFDTGNWSGTSLDTLTIMNISAAEAGTYRVRVTSASGTTVNSSNAVVTVVSPVVITTQPAVSQTVVSGTNVSFTVAVTGSTPLTYQWSHDSVDIPGANLGTYTIPSAQSSDAGNYQVVITNSVNSATSDVATLTVLIVPPTIAAQPSPRTIAPGTRAVFVVSATGSLPLAYQWRKDGADISGANSSVYMKTNVQASDNGAYSVVVTNPVNSITSAPAALTVTTNLPLYGTNLVVVRIGDGNQVLTTSGNSVYLDQLTTNGSYVNTITVPETGLSGMIEAGPDLNGSTLTGTELTRSADQKLMVLPGYHVDLGNSAALQGTAAATVPRAIGVIDRFGQYTLALADSTAYDGDHFRGAASDGAGNFWGAGSAHFTYYFGTSAPPATIQTDFVNTRSVSIFNGDLYCLASAGANGLVKFGGLPTAFVGPVTNYLPGFSSTTTTDFSVDPTGLLIYLTAGSSVQRWQSDGTTFTHPYSFTLPAGARYLTVDFSGPSPVIYVDTAAGEIYTIVDTDSSATPTLLAASGPNQLFKGIRFGPNVVRPRLAVARLDNAVVLTWAGKYPLLSATNVAGPYSPVAGATSPYTNSTASPRQQYFGLGFTNAP